jgi:hypothetical protein
MTNPDSSSPCIMVNTPHQRHLYESIKFAFDDGHTNAAASCSIFDNARAHFQNSYVGMHSMNGSRLEAIDPARREAPCVLVTTEVFGDWIGKSYLLLSHEEVSWLTRGVDPNGIDMVTLMRREFLKELDNIISAAVITKLSDDLNIKIYGDIPILEENYMGDIEALIKQDFKTSGSVYVQAGFFGFDGEDTVKPFFLWIMDGRLLDSTNQL